MCNENTWWGKAPPSPLVATGLHVRYLFTCQNTYDCNDTFLIIVIITDDDRIQRKNYLEWSKGAEFGCIFLQRHPKDHILSIYSH